MDLIGFNIQLCIKKCPQNIVRAPFFTKLTIIFSILLKLYLKTERFTLRRLHESFELE